MKRRKFLQTSAAAAVGTPLMLNGMQLGVLPSTGFLKKIRPENDRAIVIIQMLGGNDGLNMVIPLDQYDNLANARGNIILPENAVLDLNGLTALHPAMTGLKEMYDNAKLTVVHSAGYPSQNRSHFRSTDIWTSASAADEFVSSGWLGRYFDTRFPGFPDAYPNVDVNSPIALTMSSLVSETCQGEASNFSLALTNPFSLSALNQGQDSEPPDTPYGDELRFLRQAIDQTNKYNDVITGAAKHGANTVTYPNTSLGNQLKNVALLISGGLATKVFVCSIGGFDTHANQVDTNDTTIGNHANLMRTLSDAIAAFQEDLYRQNLEERVIGMTFSEFGRQIRSNASNGTDHGTAAPMFLFGKCLSGGFVGENPEIAPDVAVQEGVPMQNDFRNIYGSLLMDWFEVEEDEVKSLIFDDFEYMPILDPCTQPGKYAGKAPVDAFELNVFPNPVVDNAEILFESEDERVRITLIDGMGAEVSVVMDGKLYAGTHRVPIETSRFPRGNYYVRVQLEGRQQTKLFVKL
ncbi:MAG: DUF1501 domain-containing protein [Saprospiraceae bacterium]|nr:DUF1501 domain-containing protein [Saprospiraceae bacterium]